jgi:hypothetical protein
MENLLGFLNPGDVWNPLEIPLQHGELDLSALHWGMEFHMVTWGVRSAADHHSAQYLKILLYGALNSICAFNLPGAGNATRIAHLERIVREYGMIPHWKNRHEESAISHGLWILQDPHYYHLAHGDALLPMVWSPEDLDTNPLQAHTRDVWRRTRAKIWEISPSLRIEGVRMSRNGAEFQRLFPRPEDPGNRENCGLEMADVDIVGPLLMDRDDGFPESTGEMERLAWNRVHSKPAVPIYENLMGFVAPVSRDTNPSSNLSRGQSRGTSLPFHAATARRSYVTHLLRWFLQYQCRFELNAIHYSFLTGNGLLPDHEHHIDPEWNSRRIPKWDPDLGPDDRRPASPFRAIYGYEIYRDTLRAHMHAFQRQCYPHVLFPLENLLEDASWLETFPVSIEEVKFLLMFALEESFRREFYKAGVFRFRDRMDEEQTAWFQRRIEQSAPWMNFTGELLILARDWKFSITDSILEDAWDQWVLFNHLTGPLPEIHRSAMDAARLQMQNLRRIFPSPENSSSNLPSVLPKLEEIRRTVMSRYMCWLHGYVPFVHDSEAIQTANELAQDAMNEIMDVLDRRDLALNTGLAVGLVQTDRLYTDRMNTIVPRFLHQSFAGSITADTMGRMLARIALSGYDPYEEWFPPGRFALDLRQDTEWWNRQFPRQIAITSAIHYFRVAFMDRVYYAPYMDAALGRIQEDLSLPRTYAMDTLDAERDLIFTDIQIHRSRNIGFPIAIQRRKQEQYMENPHVMLIKGIPWHRNWKERILTWILTDADTRAEGSVQPITFFRLHLPDRWIVKTTKWNSDRIPAEIQYKWNWETEFVFEADDSIAPVRLVYDFRIAGAFRVFVTA